MHIPVLVPCEVVKTLEIYRNGFKEFTVFLATFVWGHLCPLEERVNFAILSKGVIFPYPIKERTNYRRVVS